jgi:phage-related protein
MEIFKLFGSIFLKSDEADKTLDKVDKKAQGLDKTLAKMGKSVTSAGKTMSTWVTGPIVAAGAGMLGLATKAGNTADRLLDLASITGMSTDAIQEYQHVAKIAGVNTEAITAAAEGFIKRLPQIQAEGGRASEVLGELGVSVEGTADQIMDNMLIALASIEDPLDRNAKGSQLFGGAWKDLAPILDMGTEGIAKAREEAQKMGLVMNNEGLNSANNFRIEMEKLKASFGAMFMEIGTKLAPILQDVFVPLIQDKIIPAFIVFSDKVGILIDWFSGLDSTTQTVILTVAGLLAGIGPLLLIIGKVITVVSTLIPIFTKLGGVIGLLTNPIGIVIVAIGALVGAFLYLWNTNEDFRNAVIKIWENIKDFFVKAFNFIKEKVQIVFDEIKAFWDVWGDTITKVFKYYLDIAKVVFETVWNQIKIIVDTAMDLIKTIISTVWNLIVNIIKTLTDVIVNTIKLFLSILRGDWSSAWDAIKNIVGAVWSGISNNIKIITDGIKSLLGTFLNFIKDSFKNAWGGVADVTKTAFDGIYGTIKSIINKIIDAMNGMVNGLNRLKFSIPDWIPGMGGKNFSLNIPNIPKLAMGGNIQQPGRVLVGERGPEFLDLPRGARVTPLGESGGINITITGNTILNDRDADRFGSMIVDRLRMLGVS